MAYVYIIEVDGVVRYIGKGKGWRIDDHMRAVRRIQRRRADGETVRSGVFHHRLIRAIEDGATVTARKLSDGLTDTAAFDLERNLIAVAAPGQLWNVRPGGLGGMSEAELERRRSPEFREQMSATIRVSLGRPEVRKRISDGVKRAMQTSEAMAAGLKAGRTPEARKRQGKALTKSFANDPSKGARRAEIMRRLWTDPEYRAKCTRKAKPAMPRQKHEGKQ